MEKLREETVTNVRACLISVKGRVELRQLSRDYYQLMGCEIPYRKLGCSSLEEFLRSEPTLLVYRGPDGHTLVDAKANDKTAHISQMVAKQKAAKKKPPMRSMHKPSYSRYNSYNNYSQQHHYSNQNQNPGSNWRPKNVSNKWRTNFENSTRPAALSHNQFVNISNNTQQKPLVPINQNPANARLKPLVNHNNNVPQDTHPAAKGDVIYNQKSNLIQVPKEDKVPNSKGSIQSMMQKLGVPKSPDISSPTYIENLKKDAFAAFNANDPIWNEWTTSASDSDSSFSKEKHFTATGDFINDLENFMKFHHLPAPICKIHKNQTKPHKPVIFICHLKADGESFTSYPKDFYDEHSAKYVAYRSAFEELVKKYGTSNKQNTLLSNESDILERIPLLVQKHYSGIWSWQVEADYKDIYGEQLLPNWLEVLSTSPNISMEAYNSKFVLHYCRPEDLLQKGKVTSQPLSYDVSIPTSSIQFNEHSVFLAEVTCSVSTKEIWCRQILTTQALAFEKMILAMELMYNKDKENKNSMKAVTVVKGCYYAAYIEGNWFRVRVLDVNNDGVECLLVDRGDDQVVQHDCIYQLRREFAREPCQAFVCRLAGLEELYEVSAGSEHLLNLEGMRVRLELCIDENENTEFDPINVVLYDADSGEIINQELMSLITIENALPILDKTVLNEVYIVHVDPKTSDICIQIHSLGYDKLESLLSDLEIIMREKAQDLPVENVTPDSNPNSLYFMKTKDDDKHYRVKINDWSPCKTMVQMYYVDIGRTAVVKVKDAKFYPLDEISSVVSRFPEQALRVRMDLEKVPDDFVQQVMDVCPQESPVLLRVVKESEPPIVKLFVRVNNGFFSVNESISVSLEPHTKSVSPVLDKFNNKLMKLENGVPSTGNLKSPELPQVGDFFDVYIPTAVHPFNFFVQPYKTRQRLNALMRDLQQRFADPSKFKPLGIDDVVPGGIYASNLDGKWYRTSVIKTIHPKTISVFYCDFGHYSTLSHLYPLDPEFLELPYQAIKAKLLGIAPSHGKWTVDDCRYFTHLVTKKSYVSILHSIDRDEMYNIDSVLSLKLIDTSTNEDIHIDEVLIHKKIAIKA